MLFLEAFSLHCQLIFSPSTRLLVGILLRFLMQSVATLSLSRYQSNPASFRKSFAIALKPAQSVSTSLPPSVTLQTLHHFGRPFFQLVHTSSVPALQLYLHQIAGPASLYIRAVSLLLLLKPMSYLALSVPLQTANPASLHIRSLAACSRQISLCPNSSTDYESFLVSSIQIMCSVLQLSHASTVSGLSVFLSLYRLLTNPALFHQLFAVSCSFVTQAQSLFLFSPVHLVDCD